tara:strand:- start:765 stop:1223 length:459 start_codon:yes stop_codon:yes gene_type:complete
MEIKIDEFYKRLATVVRISMNEDYADSLIGYGWQIPENDFFNDFKGYVTVGDWNDKDINYIEKEIEEGLSDLHEFLMDFYTCAYEDNDGNELEGSLREGMATLDIEEGFKTDWTLKEINKKWDLESGFTFTDEEWSRTYEENLEIIANEWED